MGNGNITSYGIYLAEQEIDRRIAELEKEIKEEKASKAAKAVSARNNSVSLSSAQKAARAEFKSLKLAATRGDPEAQNELGDCYGECWSPDYGIELDRTEAVEWYIRAADQGYAPAQFNLGWCYANGEGIKKNYKEAIKWYKLAAEQGHEDALVFLGDLYANGEGVEQNDAEAVKWYKLAAEQGFKYAQYALGNCYKDGKGIEQDDAEAAKWFKLAAEQGHEDARYALGNCYKDGKGVNQDDTEAAKWFKLAADQGHKEAQNNLAIYYANGKCAKQDDAEAIKYYELAAEKGNADAQYNLGVCYVKGQGVMGDDAKAVKWFKLAAEQGHQEAQKSLKKLQKKPDKYAKKHLSRAIRSTWINWLILFLFNIGMFALSVYLIQFWSIDLLAMIGVSGFYMGGVRIGLAIILPILGYFIARSFGGRNPVLKQFEKVEDYYRQPHNNKYSLFPYTKEQVYAMFRGGCYKTLRWLNVVALIAYAALAAFTIYYFYQVLNYGFWDTALLVPICGGLLWNLKHLASVWSHLKFTFNDKLNYCERCKNLFTFSDWKLNNNLTRVTREEKKYDIRRLNEPKSFDIEYQGEKITVKENVSPTYSTVGERTHIEEITHHYYQCQCRVCGNWHSDERSETTYSTTREHYN